MKKHALAGCPRLLAAATIATLATLAVPALAQEHGSHPQRTEEAYGIQGQSHVVEGHGENHAAQHGVDGKMLAFQLFNFGLLLFILVKYAGGALNKALRERHEKMKVDLDEAQRLRSEAEAKLKAQEGRLANLENEVIALRKSMQDSAEQEKQRMIAAAEARVARMEEETKFLLDQQVKQAELNFKADVAAAAARIAEQIVRAQVNSQDQQRLVTSFVAEVQTDAAHTVVAPAGRIF